MKTQAKSKYEIQAEKFLADTQTTFTVKLIGHGPYFEDDTKSRDIYEVTLSRLGKRPFIFRFGQSLKDSGPSINESFKESHSFYRSGRTIMSRPEDYDQKRKTPNAYDVLASVTKYDPGTFSDFCANFGYDTDSKKAERIYFAVQNEHKEIERLFTDVLEALNEIN